MASSAANIKGIQSGASISHLPPAAQMAVMDAFVKAFHDMFLLAIPIALAAFVVSLFLRETPLRGHNEPIAAE
jgi:hypothetical protein